MNKIALRIYHVLTLFVVLSMALSLVGPVRALNTTTVSTESPAKLGNQTPYSSYLTNPYTGMLSGAPLDQTSIADLTETDPLAMLRMASVPVPFTPAESGSPFGALSLLDGQVKAPGALSPSARILSEAQAQSAKTDDGFSLQKWWSMLFGKADSRISSDLGERTSFAESKTKIEKNNPPITIKAAQPSATPGPCASIFDTMPPNSIQGLFVDKCNSIGLNILGTLVDGPKQLAGTWVAVFTKQALVFNSKKNAVYQMPAAFYNIYSGNGGPSGFLGLPVSDTFGSHLKYPKDEKHNFFGMSYSNFENGFIVNDIDVKAYRFFPTILYFGKTGTVIPAVVDKDGNITTPEKEKMSFSISAGPASHDITANFHLAYRVDEGNGFGDYIPLDISVGGGQSKTINIDTEFASGSQVEFYAYAVNNDSDGLKLYAPCDYVDTNSPYGPMPVRSSFTKPTDECDGGGGGGGGDTTPPQIKIVEVWPDGRGNLAVSAEVTDSESAVASVTISGDNIQNAPMTYVGNNLYHYAFRNIPNGKIVDFVITATNGAGLTATAEGSSRSPKYFNISTWPAKCKKCDKVIGDPVPLGSLNFAYSLPVMYLAGPGQSSIAFSLTYNSQDPRIGAYGQGWTGPYQMSLDFRDNALLKGIDVTYPDGRLILFEDQGNGIFKSTSPGVSDQIEKQGSDYVLTIDKAMEYQFDSTGRLTVIRDLNKNEIRLSYIGSQLTRIENDGGRWINLTYAGNTVSALDGPEGKHVEFGYTGSTLTSFKDLLGQTWSYTYQTHDNGTLLGVDGQPYQAIDYWMTEIKTPKGHDSVKNIYNDKGEVVEQWVGGREHRQFNRDEAAHTTTVTDAYTKVTKYSYDEQWRLIRTDYPDASYEKFEYDDNFNRTFWRDRNGKEWHYTYDDRGNRLTEDGPMGYHREWQYHATFNKPIRAEEKMADGKTSVWTFDYDEKGNLKSICNPYNCGAMTYNERGEPLTVTDFAGNITTNSYEADWDLASTKNGEGETTTFGTDDAGRTIRITSPLSKTFNFTFDPSDKLTDVKGPMGYHTSTSYDPNGNIDTQTDANGGHTIYTFDTAEKLTSIKNQNSVVIATYEYGDMSEVKSFTDGEGRTWTYDNDSDQRMVGMHGPLGVNILYTRDPMGNIIDMTDAEGRVTHTDYDGLYHPITIIKNVQKGKAAKDPDANITTSFSFDLVGNLLQTIDPETNPTVFDYDLLNRIVYMRDAEGQETRWEYTELGSLKKLTNPRGKVISFTYDKADRKQTFTNQLNFVTHYAYDKDGHLSDVTDAEALHVVTHYTYDDLGRMSAEIRNYKNGGPQDTQTNVTTSYTYDLAGNLKTVTAPRGEVATYAYDPAFRLKEAVDFAGGHTKYEYDNVNNLLKVTDGNGHETKYGVDALNRVFSITNPEGHTVKFTFNKTGAMTDLVDANSNPTHFTLDRLDRVTTMLDAMNGTWHYDYDKVGNILVETDANSHPTKFSYDKVYRLLSSTDAESNVTQYAWDENGNLKTLTDGNKHATDFIYDDADQLISLTNAEKETTQYKYNALGYQSQLIEADNTVTAYGYDPLYRLNQVTENQKPNGPSNNDTNVVTRYLYDKNSNLEQFINAKGAITKFEHDGMGRVTKETNPLNSVWQYQYDSVGNLIRRVDANGHTTLYNYYPDDKPQQISYFDGTTVKFAYDKNNNLTSMQDKLGTSTWHYDALNRVKDVTDSLGRQLAFGYDAVGNRLSMVYPDGNKVTKTYYANNWLKSMTSPGGTTTYAPDHVGNILHISNPNSTETVITYDNVNRTKTLLNQQLTGASKINSKFEYTYDKVSDVTNVVSTYASKGDVITNGKKVGWQKHVDVNESYQYDGLHRLSSVNRSGTIIDDGKPSHVGWKMTYAYDKVGNRTQWTTDDNPFTNNPKDGLTATYTYNTANELTVTKVDAKRHPDNVTINYTYDKNGNRTNKLETPLTGVKRGTSYAYDPENRLVTAQDYQINGANKRIDRAVTTLAYDGLGRRLAQTYDPKMGGGGAKRVEYTFDGLDPVVETQMWNKQYDNYYRGALGRISVRQHFPAGTDGQLMWYDYNFKGDVAGLSKQSGQSIHNYQYDPYGGVIPQTGNFTDPHNDYTLTGKEYDNNTGLIYFGTRHYDPQSAQWMTQDSYRGQPNMPISLHRYAYVLDNPTTYFDVNGQKASVTYDSASNTIIVKANIRIYGPGASDDVAKYFKKSIDEVWNTDCSYQGIPVKFDINVYHKDVWIDWFWGMGKPWFWYGDKAEENTIKVESGTNPDFGHPDVEFGDEYDWGHWYAEMDGGIVAHEAAHIFQLPDNYNYDTGHPNPGYDDYITGNPNGWPKPNQKEIDEIASKAKK